MVVVEEKRTSNISSIVIIIIVTTSWDIRSVIKLYLLGIGINTIRDQSIQNE